jgi:hypothetical protein
MNIAVARAADGLPRRAFTVDDIHRMIEAGIFSEDERFELIEGDLVMMSRPDRRRLGLDCGARPRRGAADLGAAGICNTIERDRI